jgi:hypothetical protein
MKSSVLIICLILCGFASQSQESDLFQLWPDTTLAKANSGAGLEYMSHEEKLTLFYINLVRINPNLFGETYLEDYLVENNIKKDKAIKSLIKTLSKTSARVILKPSEALTITARAHAIDMGKTGRTGHNSSKGESFATRMDEPAKMYRGLNENANYGNEHALDIVIDLLIDRNVSNVGHRKNILDIEMRYMGVAIEPHVRYGYNCVQDFGGHLSK